MFRIYNHLYAWTFLTKMIKNANKIELLIHKINLARSTKHQSICYGRSI